MLTEKTVTEFLHALGSGNAVPGGGSASALAAALAANLLSMVVEITVAKESDKTEALSAARGQVASLAEDCRQLVDRDAQAYQRVKEAYKLPKSREDEKVKRTMEIQMALREAANVPLELADKALRLMQAADIVVEMGRTSCISDAGVANFLALSAIMGALLNVEVNLQGIDDEEFVRASGERVADLQERSRAQFDRLQAVIANRLYAAT